MAGYFNKNVLIIGISSFILSFLLMLFSFLKELPNVIIFPALFTISVVLVSKLASIPVKEKSDVYGICLVMLVLSAVFFGAYSLMAGTFSLYTILIILMYWILPNVPLIMIFGLNKPKSN